MEWYVVHTYSGHENKVKKSIERAIATREDLKDKFGEILVPTEDIVEMREGKKVSMSRKYYPSYVIIQMEMTKETQYLVTNVTGVTSFVGSGAGKNSRPIPLRESEVKRLLSQIRKDEDKEAVEVPFKVGDSVTVIDGPFKEFTGKIEEINPERNKVKVMVSIFGRATPVEFDFLQVKLIQ
ncbi:MAG: transcription termination/antitermination factor NusG [Gemmatimonadetes bacterium]|nr:MAG: transcription termination/antitermination factor NusG [Gemmatimonadota bacterium]